MNYPFLYLMEVLVTFALAEGGKTMSNNSATANGPQTANGVIVYFDRVLVVFFFQRTIYHLNATNNSISK